MAVRPPLRIAHSDAPGGTALAIIYGLENLSRAVIAPVIALAGLELLQTAQSLSVALFLASLASLVLILSSGFLIQRLSRKIVFTLACVLAIASVYYFTIDEPWAFVVANALRSSGAGLILICVSLYTMDFISNQNLAKVESRKILFAASSWIVFPAIGTWLWVNVGKAAPFYLSGVFMVGLLTVFWWLRITEAQQISVPKHKNLGIISNVVQYMKNGHMRMAYLIAVTRSIAWVMFFTYGPIYVVQAGISEEWVGLIIGVVVSVLLFSSQFSRFAVWFGIRRTIVYCFSLGGILFAIIGLLPEPTIWAFGLFFLASLTMDTLDVIGNLPFMRMVRKGARVEMTTVFSSWREFSFVLTPGASAILLAFLPLQGLFLALGLSFIGASFALRRLPERVG
ncbi:MAG: MFS transporter [Pseudomonadota bacterium]